MTCLYILPVEKPLNIKVKVLLFASNKQSKQSMDAEQIVRVAVVDSWWRLILSDENEKNQATDWTYTSCYANNWYMIP